MATINGLATTAVTLTSTDNLILQTSGNVTKKIPVSNIIDTDITLAGNSDVKLASQKAAKAYADGKVADVLTNGVLTIAPSQNAVFDALALKQNAITGALTLDKAATSGIKVDLASPTYGWRDIIGDITPRALGGPAPILTAFRGGNILEYAYAVNNVVDKITYHMPHDYVDLSNVFLHVHWSHNGTAISGTFTVEAYAIYCKGFNQAGHIFEAEKVLTLTEAVTSVTTHPRWGHFVTEVQLSTPGGSASKLDTNKLEVDGLIEVAYKVTAIPTITGGSTANPFIFTADVHYQSTNIGTKAKAPKFYT